VSLGSDGGCLLEAAAAGFDAALLLGGGAAGLCFSKIPITACLEVGYGNQKKIYHLQSILNFHIHHMQYTREDYYNISLSLHVTHHHLYYHRIGIYMFQDSS